MVNLRFGVASVLKALSKSKMEFLCSKDEKLNASFNRYKLKVIKQGRNVPLDYVMALPKKITDELNKMTRAKLFHMRRSAYEEFMRERLE